MEDAQREGVTDGAVLGPAESSSASLRDLASAVNTRDPLLARLASTAPDFCLAAAFLITWLAPYTFGERVVAYLMLVMLLEFIIVHSSGFMGSVMISHPLSRRTKVRSLLGLGAFYLLFAAAFSVGFGAWWPLWTILLLTLNRVLVVLTGDLPDGRERDFIRRGWAVGVLLYVGGVFITLFLPVPRFGITPEVVLAQDLPGGGIWIDEPHRVVAFGVLYFFGTGISELFSHRWLPADARSEKP